MATQRPLEGKLAMVTGASQGIGEAISTRLATLGANLILNYYTTSAVPAAQSLATKLSSTHKVRAIIIQADMGTISGPEKLVSEAREAWLSSSSLGDASFQIDIVINNAGVALNGALSELDASTMASNFERSFNVNVRGPLLLLKHCLPHLPSDRSGRVVSLSSVSSSLGFVKQSVYGATKAALEAMTRTWARELSERATVNAVNPGPTLTRMYYEGNDEEVLAKMRPFIEHTPLMAVRDGVDDAELCKRARETAGGGRPGYVEEVAAMVGLLCMPEAGWCTGQVVCANGGMVMLH